MSSSVLEVGFDSLYYAFANDNQSDVSRFAEGCCKLIFAVIAYNANGPDGQAWIRSASFRFYCELLGFDPERVRSEIVRLWARGRRKARA